MEKRYVSDRLWNEHYNDGEIGRELPDILGLFKPQISSEAGAPCLRVRKAIQYSTPDRCYDSASMGEPIGVYLYMYLEAGKYEDPYITYYIGFDKDITYEQNKEVVKSTKIRTSKDGTVTITSANGRVTTQQLPVPDSNRAFRKYVEDAMEESDCFYFGGVPLDERY